MKMLIAIIMTSAAALADTWTMTNGVPITGTVVSSQVACVWIKTPLGAVRQIPVLAFDSEARERLPQDAAGIYVAYDLMERAATKGMDVANAATDKLMAFVAESGRRTVDLKAATDSLESRQRLLLAEVEAWRDANAVPDASPKQRQAFVDKQVGKTASEILKEQ